MVAELHIDDPELGHLCVRPITVDEQMQILHKAQDVDIDRGEAVFRPGFRPLSEAEKKVPRVQAQIEQIRKDLYMHAVVRACRRRAGSAEARRGIRGCLRPSRDVHRACVVV